MVWVRCVVVIMVQEEIAEEFVALQAELQEIEVQLAMLQVLIEQLNKDKKRLVLLVMVLVFLLGPMIPVLYHHISQPHRRCMGTRGIPYTYEVHVRGSCWY